jgi:tetratricopeptide (TPR) repeat protein
MSFNLLYTYNNRGISKHVLKDYKGALQDYDKTIGIAPEYGTAYHNRGLSKYIIADYMGAIKDYDKSLQD